MIDFKAITTRGGDRGQTSIADGSRRFKDDLLIEVLGEVDELHATLGLVKVGLTETLDKDEIDWIQRALIRIGGMVAVPISHPSYGTMDLITTDDIEMVESWQKEAMKGMEMPRQFITYGGSQLGASTDLARAVCRRAERRMVTLIRERGMRELGDAQRFLNRLSDYLFVRGRQFDATET